MPTYDGVIGNFTVGDDLDIERTVGDIPVGQTIVRAILTVKTFEASPTALLQKEITPTISDAGIIDDDVLTFTLAPDDTSVLSGGNRHWYSIKVITDTDQEYTPERGTMTPEVKITV